MRSLAFVATFMLWESAVAFPFMKKKPLPGCGPCPTGADCSTWCTSTVKTVTKQKCTTCKRNPQPIAVQRVIQKPVSYVVVQPSVTAYASKPVTCTCSTPSCGPCIHPKPVVQEFQVSCSFSCVTPECIPCPRAQPIQVQPFQRSVVLPALPPLPYTAQKAYSVSCSLTCATRGCNPCPQGVLHENHPFPQTDLPLAAAQNQSAKTTTIVVDDDQVVRVGDSTAA